MGGEPYKSLADSDIIPSSKKARLILAEQSFSPPIVEISLSKQVPNVKDIYELHFKVTVENKLRSFQFKIIRNIIQYSPKIMPVSRSLYKMTIKEMPQYRNANTASSKLKLLFFVSCVLFSETFLERRYIVEEYQAFRQF